MFKLIFVLLPWFMTALKLGARTIAGGGITLVEVKRADQNRNAIRRPNFYQLCESVAALPIGFTVFRIYFGWVQTDSFASSGPRHARDLHDPYFAAWAVIGCLFIFSYMKYVAGGRQFDLESMRSGGPFGMPAKRSAVWLGRTVAHVQCGWSIVLIMLIYFREF